MLISDYPIYINGDEYLPFKQWNVSFNDYVTTHETEAGTQEDTILRKGRRSIKVTTVCLEELASKLAQLEDEDYFPVRFFNIKTREYVTIDMRVQPSSMSVNLREGTSRLAYCNGVYDVSFALEEF